VCPIQEISIELLQKLPEHLRKETSTSDYSCYLSHNCPYEEVASLARASHLQFCLHVSMHSNNRNFLVRFVEKSVFWGSNSNKTHDSLTNSFSRLQNKCKSDPIVKLRSLVH